MKQILQLLSALLLSVLLFPAYATGNSNYSFKHIGSDVGLSSSNVKSIIQDSYGFMWFGTKNGLNRYDGVFIRQLSCFDYENNQGNDNIGALCEDKNRNIWVGTDRGIYLYNPIADKFKFVGIKDRNNGEYANNWVQKLECDMHNGVWALLPDQGIFHYYDDNVDFFRITSQSTFKEQTPSHMCIDQNSDVWVCTTGAGLYKYEKKTKKFNRVTTSDGNSMLGINFSIIENESDSLILLASDKGELFRYNKDNNTLSQVNYGNSGNILLRSLQCFDDEIWLGSQKGIFVIDKNTNVETAIYGDPLNRFSLSDDAIYYIYKSNNGDAWIGTFFGGVNYMPRNKFTFDVYGLASSLSSRRIRGMAQTSDGQIWIGTEDQGLNVLNPITKKISRVTSIPPQHKIALDVHVYNDKVYASFIHSGLDVISLGGKNYESQLVTGSDNSVYAYMKDSYGNEWVGLGYALYRRNSGTAEFKHITATGYDWIFSLFESSDGSVWIGTMGNGLWKYTPTNGNFKSYVYCENTPNGLRSNCISSIMEDSQGNIWLSTDRGGISRYNKDKDNFTSYGVHEGLPDDVAYDILEDRNGFLWFGTNKGLVKFNPNTMSIKVFTTKDGLVGNQFNYHSALKCGNKLFYFGGIEGIIAFNPEMEDKQAVSSQIYFTGLSILNEECEVGMNDSILSKNIIFTDEIKLPYDKATFSLNIVSPSFGIVGEAGYSYRLSPVNKDWIPLKNNFISFSNLSPGKYNLQVRVSNHGTNATRELVITILPPWWRSNWAYFAYLILTVCVIWIWFRWYRHYKNEQLKERQHLFTVSKEKELYRDKVKFFTEIAHEIRTPLTLIDAPLEAVEESGIKDDKVKHYLKITRQNTKRLLDLTGHLLDFQKIDSKKLTLKNENIEITSFLNEIIDRFEPTINLRKKKLVRNICKDSIIVSIDKEATIKILSNLLNNALKYSKMMIEVNMEIGETYFKFRVISDGEKILYEDGKRIFERFYQIDNRKNGEDGVGIGLPLARSLATLMNGSLEIEDNSNELNCFAVTLPLNKEDIKRNNDITINKSEYVMDEESNLSKENINGYTVLLVEDNDTMREFVAEQLAHSFTIEAARNGIEALKVLDKTHVDIIVTDIMMPEMDGFELCKTVKQDINLSHTPVVFITAKNDLDSKIRGLQYGAEGYIEKPFSVKYFKQLIFSLLENRRRERESFSKNPFFTVNNMQNNKADEEFMNKVVRIIEEHICEDSFNVEIMADIFCMSRSSLLRKIKTLFNLLPIELIRLIKLKKAAELIKEGEYRIGDICYMVGITSPSYFSKLFFKQFGISPKDFEKQFQKNTISSEVQNKQTFS